MCFIQPVFANEIQNDTIMAKYDNFTRFIYDAVTPVWKLLFEKVFFFWYILASSGIKQSKVQRAGSNRSWITDKKKKVV